MKLFTIGPVQQNTNDSEIELHTPRQLPYFRTEEFSNIISDCNFWLLNALGASSADKCIFISGSGTLAMEMSVSNFRDRKKKSLIINAGNFGARFSELHKAHEIEFDEIFLNYEDDLDDSLMSNYNSKNYSRIYVNHHETSIGKLINLDVLLRFKDSDCLLIVDAMTSFLADKLNMQSGIDVCIVSSHKGLCLSPGLSMICMSEKAIESIKYSVYNHSYLNIANYLENMQRFQTPFTPSISVIMEFHNLINKSSPDFVIRRLSEVGERAIYFRNLLRSNENFTTPNYLLSNAITPVITKSFSAKILYTRLMNEFSICVNPSSGNFSDSMIRVSHVGQLNFSDYDELFRAFERIVI